MKKVCLIVMALMALLSGCSEKTGTTTASASAVTTSTINSPTFEGVWLHKGDTNYRMKITKIDANTYKAEKGMLIKNEFKYPENLVLKLEGNELVLERGNFRSKFRLDGNELINSGKPADISYTRIE